MSEELRCQKRRWLSKNENKIVKDVFGKMRFVYPINGFALRKYRETLGISRKDFAKLCGMEIGFLRKIETSYKNIRYVSCFQRDKIVAAIIILCKKKAELGSSEPS